MSKELAQRMSIAAHVAAESVDFASTAELLADIALDDLRRAQALLSHQIPNGDLERVFERALRGLVERLEEYKFAATSRPRTPAA